MHIQDTQTQTEAVVTDAFELILQLWIYFICAVQEIKVNEIRVDSSMISCQILLKQKTANANKFN